MAANYKYIPYDPLKVQKPNVTVNIPASPIGANDVFPAATPLVTDNYKYVPYDPSKQPKQQSEYEIESMSYPKDIMNVEYGGNYAMFYINIQTESKITEIGKGYGTVNVQTGLNSVSGNIGGLAVGAYEFAVGAGQGALASTVLGKLKSFTNLGAKAQAFVAGATVGAARAIATGVIAAETGGFSQPVKRLKSAIALHMPIALSVRYSVNYEEEDIPLLLRTMSGMGADTSGTVGAGATAGLMSNAGDASGAISKLTKTAVNPIKEQVFKSVDFRTFTFNYTFAPRDSGEANNVLEIIRQFKFHMHPEFKDEDQFLYIYPSEFDITYFNNGKENDKIHRHTSCVLIDLSLNYAPQGTYATFADGMPTQIEMVMTFKELAKLDKQNIKECKF